VGGSLALSTSLQALMRLRMTGECTSQVSTPPFSHPLSHSKLLPTHRHYICPLHNAFVSLMTKFEQLSFVKSLS